ncbi:MAG: hypothetical protein B1H03_00955 [Planctomycetales bacterium 4484_113]|nr:MAG: hypothetical protein B1H03_00955 [Planctomycetales bacterium 4484_113]
MQQAKEKQGILFICIGNSCRSPMAEAICRHLAGDSVAVFSAGVAPVGEIAAGTREVLAQHGISAEGLRSKHTDEVPLEQVGLIVSLEFSYPVERVFGGEVPARCENWDIPDPVGGSSEDYERVLAILQEKVTALLKREGLFPSG